MHYKRDNDFCLFAYKDLLNSSLKLRFGYDLSSSDTVCYKITYVVDNKLNIQLNWVVTKCEAARHASHSG